MLGPEQVRDPGAPEGRYSLSDATEAYMSRGCADAIALPRDAEEVAQVVAWCYERELPIVTRGGGTGLAGGAVPRGGVVLDTTRLSRVRRVDPGHWRMEVEAGVPTAVVQRLARENGLIFPPDPGAAESSTIGGNIATNAGGPHAFRHGVTASWVTGLEVVVPPGEIVSFGGPIRKDASGYALMQLLMGSEGTLGVITAAWLRLIPAPEHSRVIATVYAGPEAGCEAISRVISHGLQPSVLEFLDGGALDAARASFPGRLPDAARFLVITEAEGAAQETDRLTDELTEALAPGALAETRYQDRAAEKRLWAWRDGVSLAVAAVRGGKLSEDIVVPPERLCDAINETAAVGARHGLPSCSWGHGGDGNIHSTFLVDPTSADELDRARAASQELFDLAVLLGGSVSGEHGLGRDKSGTLERSWSPRAIALHEAVKLAFDPKGLLNPGVKSATRDGAIP